MPYLYNNVHYLPQAQKQKQVRIYGKYQSKKITLKTFGSTNTIIFATGPAVGKTLIAVLVGG